MQADSEIKEQAVQADLKIKARPTTNASVQVVPDMDPRILIGQRQQWLYFRLRREVELYRPHAHAMLVGLPPECSLVSQLNWWFLLNMCLGVFGSQTCLAQGLSHPRQTLPGGRCECRKPCSKADPMHGSIGCSLNPKLVNLQTLSKRRTAPNPKAASEATACSRRRAWQLGCRARRFGPIRRASSWTTSSKN